MTSKQKEIRNILGILLGFAFPLVDVWVGEKRKKEKKVKALCAQTLTKRERAKEES